MRYTCKSAFLRTLSFFIPLASLLSFSVQPIVGKYLLPNQGGNVSSWFTIMLFFQFSLLIGYLFAFQVNKLSLEKQYVIFIILAVLSVISFSLYLRTEASLTAIEIMLFLSANLMFPMVLLFSFSILLQGWLSYADQTVPYYLYAVSSFGSLLGLMLYPFVIEPFFPLTLQSYMWGIIFHVFLLLSIILVCFLFANIIKNGKAEAKPKAYVPRLNLRNFPNYFLWVFLNLVPCVLFLDFTRLLTIEIGSHPLSWTVPLGYYLLSMSFAFSVNTSTRNLNFYFVLLFVGVLLLTFCNVLIVEPLSNFALIGYGFILLGGISGGLRLLYFYRPHEDPEHFNSYYICLGIGGVLAGILVNFVFPFVLIRPVEGIIACYMLLALWVFVYFNDYSRVFFKPSAKIFYALLILIIPVILVNGYFYISEKVEFPDRRYYRSIYSTYKVDTDTKDGFVLLLSGFTMHGAQIINEPLTPTAYYWTGSPLGLWMEYYKDRFEAYDIGIVGLGVGVASAYNRENDRITYFDIDPLVADIAFNETSFLSHAKGRSDIVIEDGRVGINRYGPFDFIVVDAFSGAGIPQHLITKEAIVDFMEKSKNGVLLFHISNKYWDLRPLIRGICIEAGYSYKIVRSHSIHDILFTSATYAFIYEGDLFEFWNIVEENNLNYFLDVEEEILWTDDMFSILDLKRPPENQ